MAIDFPASPTLNDVFTVGNVTYVWDGTKWTASVTGGISLDKIEEGNTSAEVIDTGSDGRFVVTTEGTERLRVTNTGLVGIGTTSPTVALEVNGGTDNEPIKVVSTDAGSYIAFADNATTVAARLGAIGDDFKIDVNSSERLRIDSLGRVGIGTSSPGDFQFYAKSAGAYSAAFETTTDQSSNGAPRRIVFTARNFRPSIEGQFFSGTWQSNDLLINPSGGNVGIGDSAPGDILTVGSTSGSFNAIRIQSTNTGITELRFADSDSANPGYIKYEHNGNNLVFAVNAGERFRCDSAGRLLVGTSTARANLFNATISAGLQLEAAGALGAPNRFISVINNFATAGDGGGVIALGRSKGGTVGSNTVVAANDQLGRFDFQGNDGTQFVSGAMIEAYVDGTSGADDMPGRLVFSTTADGASSPTERMRIRANGELTTLSSIDAFAPKSTVGAGTSSALIYGRHSATTVNDGTTSFIVWTNGNVQNTNNSYGAISDIKLKENIVDANSQWDDLKALQVRNYNFKEGQTHTQIGLVAQEAELVSPGLVSESPDRDEDGNDLGTVTKSVNYSVLYMKAVKALQEAMERIETLEGMVAVNNITIDEQQHQLSTLAARLTALESA
jgi:hypothetical protein